MRRIFLSAEERRHVQRVAFLLALPLVLVVLIPTFISIGLAYRESQSRTSENMALIERVEERAREERAALVSLVCADVQVADETQDPEALLRAARFRQILRNLGAHCPGTD